MQMTPRAFAVLALLVAITVICGVLGAYAHDAPKGWRYDLSCCSNMDCRPVPASAVHERPEGYVIAATGEVIPYSDKRIKQSPDGDLHWCSVGGKPDSRTICLYVPPKGM